MRLYDERIKNQKKIIKNQKSKKLRMMVYNNRNNQEGEKKIEADGFKWGKSIGKCLAGWERQERGD